MGLPVAPPPVGGGGFPCVFNDFRHFASCRVNGPLLFLRCVSANRAHETRCCRAICGWSQRGFAAKWGAQKGGHNFPYFSNFLKQNAKNVVTFWSLVLHLLASIFPPLTRGICQFMASFLDSCFNVCSGIALVYFLCF